MREYKRKQNLASFITKKVAHMSNFFLAVPTRLELATSGVTGRYSNQLNYSTVFVVGVYGFEPQTLCL